MFRRGSRLLECLRHWIALLDIDSDEDLVYQSGATEAWWSKIAELMPGRTDNEIKNYWRTKVQKHAKQLRCDVNSKKFKDVMRNLWMPRLVERIGVASSLDSCPSVPAGQQEQCPEEEVWMSSSSNSFSNANGYYLKDGKISSLDEIQLDYFDGWLNTTNLDETLVDDSIREMRGSLSSFEDGW